MQHLCNQEVNMNTREDERHLIAQLAGKSLYHRLNNLPKSLTELSDSELVTAYLDGNTAAFTVIVSRYYRLMLWVAHKYTDRIIDAEDLLQDALLRAAKGLHVYRGECSLGAWLHRLVANAGYDYLQKEPAAHPAALDDDNQRRTIEGMLAHNPVDMEITALEIRRAINYLTGISAELGEVFILMDLKGYNQQEAARITGVSGSTVKTRRFQARTYLRDALAA